MTEGNYFSWQHNQNECETHHERSFQPPPNMYMRHPARNVMPPNVYIIKVLLNRLALHIYAIYWCDITVITLIMLSVRRSYLVLIVVIIGWYLSSKHRWWHNPHLMGLWYIYTLLLLPWILRLVHFRRASGLAVLMAFAVQVENVSWAFAEQSFHAPSPSPFSSPPTLLRFFRTGKNFSVRFFLALIEFTHYGGYSFAWRASSFVFCFFGLGVLVWGPWPLFFACGNSEVTSTHQGVWTYNYIYIPWGNGFFWYPSARNQLLENRWSTELYSLSVWCRINLGICFQHLLTIFWYQAIFWHFYEASEIWPKCWTRYYFIPNCMKLVNSGRKNRAVQLTPTELGGSQFAKPHRARPTPTPHRDRIQHPVGWGLTRLGS